MFFSVIRNTFFAILASATLTAHSQETIPLGNAVQVAELGDLTSTAPAAKEENLPPSKSSSAPRDTGPALDPDFINFGYIQSYNVAPYLHYESITHIAPPFVGFDYNGNISASRISTFRTRNTANLPEGASLLAGGSADRAGTKVIACVNNPGEPGSGLSFDGVKLATVMQNPTLRQNLVNDVVTLVTGDAYCQGVNFDFEPSWNSATRDGITAFLQEMRTALPLPYEISIYVHPIYSSTYWDMPNIINNVDYVLYSTYDWGTQATAHAPSDFDNCLSHIISYLNAGVPPSKMVLTWASYGRRWRDVITYNGANDGDPLKRTSWGFYNGNYQTTLGQANGGPFTTNYVTGDEIGWYNYTQSGTNYTAVFETPDSIAYKISAARSFPGNTSGSYAGARLRGVGWWSLMWVSDYFNGFRSRDPISNTSVYRPPYYRHIDLLAQEILKPAGRKQFVLESFENANDHWRDPNESPDTVANSGTSFNWVTSPSGTGRPPGTNNAAQLAFSFGSTTVKRAFLRHEMINNYTETAITDTNATLARINKNSRISGYYHVAANYSPRTLRLALVDGSRQIEVSDPINLPAAAGWYQFNWDINDPTQVNAFNTSEPGLLDGNGTVNTAGADARDISFLGFMVEGGAAGSGVITFDSITYESHAPFHKNYVINEFRYSNNSSEFVEIAGPAGPLPGDLALISYNSADGTVLKSTSLGSYTMPASGLLVIGDSGVPNASGSTGATPASWSSGDDISAAAPGGLQLYGTASGYAYDSVTYRALGGIKDLARTSTREVVGEGPGWLGETGSGTSAATGTPISFSRNSSSSDTHINDRDFTLSIATPGQPNSTPGVLGSTYNFSSIPSTGLQTYQALKIANPVAAGLPPSISGDTSALRVVDTAGGGTQAYFGDAELGAGTGLDITGRLYIPAAAHPAQAVAVGFCGTQGSTFFSASPASSGYENGYWLIYENGTVGLNDGRANHPGKIEFVMASNDNQDSVISLGLGSQLTLTPNTWVNFRLRIDPLAGASQQLLAQINGSDVYRGAIPAGGRTYGPFTVGFRETDNTVAATEGTWVDNVSILSANSKVGDYQLY